MNWDKQKRYVDRGPCDGSGRCRYIDLMVGDDRVARYKGYTKKIEDVSMVLYPFRVFNSVLCDVPGRHVVSIFAIKSQ